MTPNYRLFVVAGAFAALVILAADVSLIGFHNASERCFIGSIGNTHRLADAMAEIPSRLIGAVQISLKLFRAQSLFRIDHERRRHEPLFERQMSIVENRSLIYGELALAGSADVEDAGRNGLGFDFASLRIDYWLAILTNRAESSSLDVLRNLIAVAVDAARAVRPSQFFEEIDAGFLGSEGLCYVYQVRFRYPLDVVWPFLQLLSSR